LTPDAAAISMPRFFEYAKEQDAKMTDRLPGFSTLPCYAGGSRSHTGASR